MIYYEMRKHLNQGDKIYTDIYQIEWGEFKAKYLECYVHKTFVLKDVMHPRYHKTLDYVRRYLRIK